MALEIERKFLVVNDRWREHVAAKQELKDGFLSRDGDKKVRVRSFGDRPELAAERVPLTCAGMQTAELGGLGDLGPVGVAPHLGGGLVQQEGDRAQAV